MMKKRLTAFLVTAVMSLSMFSIPTMAADELTYGEYKPSAGSVHVISTDPNLVADTTYHMIAIATPEGAMLTAQSGTTGSDGKLDITIENVGNIADVDGWSVIVRENRGGVATRGPLILVKDETPKPPTSSGGGGGGGGGGASSSYTLTISSDSNSIKANVKISGNTATISKIDNIDKIINNGVVKVDLTSLKKDINVVNLDSSIVNAIANSEDNEGIEIKFTDGTVILDADAVVSLKGRDLNVKLDKTSTATLNTKQKDAVKSMDVHAVYEVTVNGLKSLSKGNADVEVPFSIPSGKNASNFVLMFVADDGTLKEVSAKFSGGQISFTAEQFGDYVVVYRESAAPINTGECDGGANCPSRKFIDVDTSMWYHKAIDYAITNGLMNGMSDNEFSPNSNLSRAMLAQILYNIEGRPSVAGVSEFDDVDAGMWYTNAVVWATENGIVSGYGNGQYGPNDNITREQLAVMLYRYAGSPAASGSLSNFVDAGNVSDYAQNALIWATANGIVNGKGAGNLDPRGLATRAEVAQMLYSYMSK